jgi:hypothetical protein
MLLYSVIPVKTRMINHAGRAMRAVIPVVRSDILAWRKRTGADMWDEMRLAGDDSTREELPED